MSRAVRTDDELDEYDEAVQKGGHRGEDTKVVTIDQFRKTVGADLTYASFPVAERPTVDVSAARDGINFLGARSDEGNTSFLECNRSFTTEVRVRFLQILQAEFGEKLVVVIDKTSYFTAKKVSGLWRTHRLSWYTFRLGWLS